MSVVLDLNPELFGLEDGEPWPGDATWTNLGWGGLVEGVTVNGHHGLRFAFTTAPGAVQATTVDIESWTLHLVARISEPPVSAGPGLLGGGGLQVTPDREWHRSGWATDPLAGLHLITLVNGPEPSMFVDGREVANPPTAGLTSSLILGAYAAGLVLDVLRLQVVSGVPGTLAADMAGLVAQYGIAPPLAAHGTVSFVGAGHLTIVAGDTYPGDEPPLPEGVPGGAVEPPPLPEPTLPPVGVPDPLLWRRSEIMPAPTLDDHGNPIDWEPTTVVHEEYARPQIVIEGVDITYLHDAPTPFPRIVRVEPFGSAEASIELPQLTPFHSTPAWCVPGASVDVRLIKTGGERVHRFAGVVDTFGHNADTGVFTIECLGSVFTADLQLRQPGFSTAPRDIGRVIADTLNSTVSRRFKKVAPVVTGARTSVLGGWEPKVTGYIQQLLATAVSEGEQWTVKCAVRQPVIELKDLDTVSWTVRNGQRGVKISLQQDWGQAPNVIFGEGVSPDGGRWRNAMYPNWRPDDTPPYPLDPSKSFYVGLTDAGTNTGTGVSDWQAKVNQPVTGRYSLEDRTRCMEVQRAAGIQVDGSVGPQTWAATFGTGSNTGTLECFYMPLAFAKNVMPRLYSPDGDDLGPNPAYDRDVLRVEDKIDFGQGVTKAEGKKGARAVLRRESDPGWAGTVTFELDPNERSKHEVFEGSNGRIRGFRGQNLKVHVAQVVDDGLTVEATVDTNARDYPRLNAIRDRERNATDPAKAAVKRLNQGSITEARATFDAESPAGHIPRHALFANLWTVIRVPLGSYGSVAKTVLRTTGPARPFAVGVFAKPVTHAQLMGLIGNPLTAQENPWSEHADALEKLGLLMAWGWKSQPCGYYPKTYSTPEGEDRAPVTGRFEDDASWEFATVDPPWVWVAQIASGGCHIEGRFWPGVD